MNHSPTADTCFTASRPKKKSYFPIQKVFEETALNELRHAKVFMKMLETGVVPCNVTVDADKIQDTAANLQIAIKEERDEGVARYLADAKIAEEEGFPEIADHFRAIASIEQHHLDRFERYLKRGRTGQYGNVTRQFPGVALCAAIHL